MTRGCIVNVTEVYFPFSVIQALQFHLGEVLGMSQWYDKFGILGISDKKLQGEQ